MLSIVLQVFQERVNDGRDREATSSPTASLVMTRDLSLQTMTFIAKLPCTAGLVVTSKKIIFTLPQMILLDIKYSLRIYPDIWRNRSQVKIPFQNTEADRGETVPQFTGSTPNTHGKHKKGERVHVTTKSTEIQQAT